MLFRVEFKFYRHRGVITDRAAKNCKKYFHGPNMFEKTKNEHCWWT